MAISRWDPWRDFMSLQNELGRMFERTFGGGERRGWTPAVDVYERDNEIVVRAELPGVKPEDVDIKIQDDSLRIRGERRFSEEIKEENYYRLEQRYGSFERVIPLPAAVDREKAKAKYRDGVLEVDLPKSERAKPKEIKVEIQ